MGTVRPLSPTAVGCVSRNGVDLGTAYLPWPNVAPGDVLVLSSGDAVRVVDVVHAPAGSVLGALVKIAPLPARAPAP